ncbi:MAG TPA: branched-chain amino acid transaminase [Candidatus Bathyarchaeia archaeon]|nr:branched-chain amino acid transaminase [Candidatus Bathyarchaeia archaeon]
MDKATKIWMNGELVDWDNARVHVLTHALHYGTAVFEGMRCYKTAKGPAVFRLRDHIARLVRSSKTYLMDLRYTPDQIGQAVKATVKANGFEDCYIRPIAYVGFGEMGVNPLPNKTEMSIAVWRWGAYLGKEALSSGVRCMVSSWRRISPESLPPQAKCSANYANSGLAKIEAVKAGYDEAILLNTNGNVSEGTGENIFVVKDGVISTPPPSAAILRGITRESVIELAADSGIECRLTEILREDLYTADELFFSGTAAEITPIREVDGRKIGDGNFPITKKLQSSFEAVVRGRNEKFSKWLDFV